MNVVSWIKIALLLAVGYPFVGQVWGKLRRPVEALSERERRLRPLWRWQAVGISLAALGVIAWAVLPAARLPDRAGYWIVYALVSLVGGGVLVMVHARTLENRASSADGRPERASTSARYNAAWKVALLGCFIASFTSLSLTGVQVYGWLARPLMITTYVLMGLTFVLAALAGWTSKSR